MSPPLAEHFPAALLFYTTILILIGSEVSIAASHRDGAGENADHGSRSRVQSLTLLGLAGAFGAVWIPHTRLDGWWALGAGMALILAGVSLRQWAVATLGRFFTTSIEIQASHQIVETGPYAIVRHPSYLGFFLSMIGVGVALGDWASTLITIAFGTTAFVQRILVEETALRSGLGESYARYAARHSRLVPGLW